MALVRHIERLDKSRSTIHDETHCTFTIVRDDDGTRYLQLDTYGRKDRAIPDKVSQSIQFDSDAADQLKALIEEVFGS